MKSTQHARTRQHVGRLLAAVLALIVIATACTDGDRAHNGGTARANVDADGVLRLPFDLTSPQASFDPLGVTGVFYWHFAVYDTLLRNTDDNSYEPGLAKSATIVDESTIVVELHEGLTFQDGTPLDSQAVKSTIERNAASNKPGPFRLAELSQVSAIDIQSPTEFTIRLATPIAGSFYNLLAQGETMPVSPTAIANGVDLRSHPVGAGPFKVETFNPPESVKLVKWDGYFEADKIRLAGIEFVNVSGDPAAQINAMRTHAVDGMGGWNLSLETMRQFGGDVSTRTRTSPDGTVYVSLQCDKFAPFRDVRVRQALNFATDRNALNDLLLDGEGEPMSQFWSKDSEWYDPTLAHVYDYDLDKAKSLLALAGVPDLHFTMATFPGIFEKAAEALQAQWEKAGITVTLVPVRDPATDYFIEKQEDTFVTPQNRLWTDKITRNFAPGSAGDVCDPRSDDFTRRLATLRATDPASPDSVQAWWDVSRYLSENAQGVFLLINVLNYAWDDNRVGDIAWAPDQNGLRYIDWHKVYIKQQ